MYFMKTRDQTKKFRSYHKFYVFYEKTGLKRKVKHFPCSFTNLANK